jgi:hypothetical protein
MPYQQDVKELAYTIDPSCWVSYSGKGRDFKGAMDGRRQRSLDQAQRQIDQLRARRANRRISRFVEEATENFMVTMTHSGGVRAVEYSDNISIGDDITRWINDGRVIERIIIEPN